MTAFFLAHRRRALFGAFLLAFVAMLFAPEAAYAATVVAADAEGFQDEKLPIFRWSEASSQMHVRVGGSDFMDTVNAMSKEKVSGSFMMLGNFFFTLATGLTRISIEFDALDGAGQEVDRAFGTLGQAILDSPIIVIVIVAVFCVGIWVASRQSHGRPLMSVLLKPIILVGVFAVLVGGATATGDSDEPAPMSPWWFGNTVNSVVTAAATSPATALQETDLGFKLQLSEHAGGPEDALSCEYYLDSLKSGYKTDTGDAAEKMSRSLALSLSNMWEATALDAYIDAQFGKQATSEGGNTHGDRVFCRMLEQNSAVKADDQVALMDGIEMQDTEAAQQSSAFAKHGSAEVDVATMYWAACEWDGTKFTVNDHWAKASEGEAEDLGDGSSKYSCSKWWDHPPSTIENDSEFQGSETDGPLNFVGDRSEVGEKLSGTTGGVASFVRATQGWESTDSVITSIVYSVSAICVSIAFGALALVVLGAKIGMIAMLMLLGIAIIFDMLPTSSGGKLKKYLMSYLGMAFLAFGVQLIFAVIVLLTSVIANAGSSFTGDGFMRNIWLGLAPIIAFVLMHMFITKWLKAPSPFTPSGAMSWAKGAAGGALVSKGLGALNDARKNVGGGGGGNSGGDNPLDSRSGAGTGGAVSRNADGSANTGTKDEMGPAGSGAAGALGDGNPMSESQKASGALGDGQTAGDEDGQALGADGQPLDGMDAGAGSGEALEGEGQSAEGEALEGAGAEGGKPDVAGSAGAEGALGGKDGKGASAAGALGGGAAAAGGAAMSRFDQLRAAEQAKKDGKQVERNAAADGIDGLRKRNREQHQALAASGPGKGAGLGKKIGHKAKMLGSSAKTLGKNSALGARAKAERAGGLRAVAGRGVMGAAKAAGRGAAGAAKWTAKNSGKAGMIAGGAAVAAAAAPVLLPASGAAALVMGVGGITAGVAGSKAGFNLSKAGVRDGFKGAKKGVRAAGGVSKKGVGGLRKIAAKQGGRAYQALYIRGSARFDAKQAANPDTTSRFGSKRR